MIIDILTLPDVCADHKGAFRDLRMRNLSQLSLDILKMITEKIKTYPGI
jgi:hypothetical protein